MEAGTERTEPAQQRRWLRRNTSVATRLALSALVVAVTAMVVASQISLLDAQDSSEALLQGRLSTIGGQTAAGIEGYVESKRIEVAELAASDATVETLRAFRGAYQELASLDRDSVQDEARKLGEWYLVDFIPELTALRDEPVPPVQLLTGGDDVAGVYLQSKYIAESPLEGDERRLLTNARDGSAWTETHRDFHPELLETVDRFELTDLYLIEPDEHAVVYSTGKDPDFATSLDSGPWSDTRLAQLVRRMALDADPERVRVSDFANHPPALDQPSMFVGSPVEADGELVGFVVVRLSTEHTDEVMTTEWRRDRFGKTGEAYLVGADGLMRSISRLFVEDRPAYVGAVSERDQLDEPDLARAGALDTTVLIQPIEGQAVDAALEGQEGRIESTNYLGEKVYTAYQPLDVPDVQWVLLAEQARDEVDAPVDDLTQDAFILTAAFVVGLTFLLVIWAHAFVSPIRRISDVIHRIRRDELDTPVPSAGVREFRELAEGFNQMADDLHVRRERVSAAVTGKLEILGRLLPPDVVRRVEEGDRDLLDSVAEATVVVLVVRGIDELTSINTATENRALFHEAVDEFDELAERNGLERVKLLADSYYAACGLGTPYLDHGPRAVTFALQASEFARRLSSERGIDISVSAGVELGAVNVGLAGEARLIYDLWGKTVDTAHELARSAAPGQVLVSNRLRERLPDDQPARPVDVDDAEPTRFVVAPFTMPEGGDE